MPVITTTPYYVAPGGWDIENASYSGNSKNVGGSYVPTSMGFKTDGTKMFVTAGGANPGIYEYSLSTPWNVSTATATGNSFDTLGASLFPLDLDVKSDGTMFIFIESGTPESAHEVTLGTPWDITTASFTGSPGNSYRVGNQDTNSRGIGMKPDGTKMYTVGRTNNRVFEYTLSSGWDLGTTSYVQFFSVNSQETTVASIKFRPNGTKMYVVGLNQDRVFEYTLGTPWDISTASYLGVNFSVNAQASTPEGLAFSPDGKKMYILNTGNSTVYEYNVP